MSAPYNAAYHLLSAADIIIHSGLGNNYMYLSAFKTEHVVTSSKTINFYVLTP
jgi:hypothetical protein